MIIYNQIILMIGSKYAENNLGVEKYQEKFSDLDAINYIIIALKE